MKTFLLTDQDIRTYLTKTDNIINEKEIILIQQANEASRLRKDMNELVSMRVSGELSKDNFPLHYRPSEERLNQIENLLP